MPRIHSSNPRCIPVLTRQKFPNKTKVHMCAFYFFSLIICSLSLEIQLSFSDYIWKFWAWLFLQNKQKPPCTAMIYGKNTNLTTFNTYLTSRRISVFVLPQSSPLALICPLANPFANPYSKDGVLNKSSLIVLQRDRCRRHFRGTLDNYFCYIRRCNCKTRHRCITF